VITYQQKEKRSWPISRVLSWAAIPLGPESLQGSSHLPASSAGHVIARLFGVAPGGGCRVSPPPHRNGQSALRRYPNRHDRTRLCGPVPRLESAVSRISRCVAAPLENDASPHPSL